MLDFCGLEIAHGCHTLKDHLQNMLKEIRTENKDERSTVNEFNIFYFLHVL